MSFLLSCIFLLTRQAPQQCYGDVFEGIVVLQMLTIAVLKMVEVSPRHQDMRQNAEGVGEWNKHRHPHVGPNHPQVTQVLVTLSILGPAPHLAEQESVADTWACGNCLLSQGNSYP